jgi:hypothetical protein
LDFLCFSIEVILGNFLDWGDLYEVNIILQMPSEGFGTSAFIKGLLVLYFAFRLGSPIPPFFILNLRLTAPLSDSKKLNLLKNKFGSRSFVITSFSKDRAIFEYSLIVKNSGYQYLKMASISMRIVKIKMGIIRDVKIYFPWYFISISDFILDASTKRIFLYVSSNGVLFMCPKTDQ